jgi:D-glycero-D-manno-heptose 1,7-bisphosphate phosphatase
MKSPKSRAIFLDRDGTINVEIDYLHEPEKFQFEKFAPEALKQLQDNGFRLIVVTNQGAIGDNLYTLTDMNRTHAFMEAELARYGIHLSGIYYCPHRYDESCNCRKPAPGMLLTAQRELGIDMQQSWMIGDKLADIVAGKRAGVRTILVLTGYGLKERKYLEDLEKCVRNEQTPDFFATTLVDAAEIILHRRNK